MKLFEYQAKDIFKLYEILTPYGLTVDSMKQAEDTANAVGFPCMLKAQVLQGGRGKAGLIHRVNDPGGVVRKAEELFSSPYKVKKVLLEEAVDFVKEIYLSVTFDPASASVVLMGCSEGGIEIETLAAEYPEKIIKEKIDIYYGLMDYQIKDFVWQMGLKDDTAKPVTKIVKNMYRLFRQEDAELVEINPLFINNEGKAIAGDAKIIIDDNSLYRQSKYKIGRDYFDTDIEWEAYQDGIPYLQFDGEIGLMCAGAGLTTTVYDLIHDMGGTVANYLEFGGPNYKKAVKAMELCLKSKSSVILIVTFGTIARADIMAEGVVEAIERLKPDRPIITCIRGTNEDRGIEILKSAGVTFFYDTEEAVSNAVRIAAERRGI